MKFMDFEGAVVTLR